MNNKFVELLKKVQSYYDFFKNDEFIVKDSYPILFFGNYERYFSSKLKIITVGINPSGKEFYEKGQRKLKRFSKINSFVSLEYLEVLKKYFDIESRDPYSFWFDNFEKVLNGIKSSYYNKKEYPYTALHTDLFTPLATDPTWSYLSEETQQRLIEQGIPLWHELIKILKPNIIICSFAERYLDEIQFKIKEKWTKFYTIKKTKDGQDRKKLYIIKKAEININGSSLYVFWGNQRDMPFGNISDENKIDIGKLIAKEVGDMENKLCFVQFIHPGVEPTPDRDGYISWNRNDHKRKFIKLKGSYVDEKGSKVEDKELIFWGEWEPQSEAIKINNPKKDEQHPMYIYEPYYNLAEINNKSNSGGCEGNGYQNTDPFVFGDRFIYSICKQRSKRGPTQIRYLEKGSVILFGSRLNNKFVVDTVFVVGNYIDYKCTEDGLEELKDNLIKRYSLSENYIEKYFEISLYRFMDSLKSGNEKDKNYRLYIGATYEDKHECMFSYFPCQPYKKDTQGFVRPNVNLKGKITQELKQGIKLPSCNNIDEVRKYWNKVTRQIINKGLNLGIISIHKEGAHYGCIDEKGHSQAVFGAQ